MNANFSQSDRQGRLSTALGPDALVLLRMDGTEELSGDFEWRVEALSTRPDLDLHALLGTHATVEIDHATGSGDSGGDETPYDGTYVLAPDDTPFRPEQRTLGPSVKGPETAVVVGEGEIDCDEHGRILVKFHWDDVAAHTMRVRVSQNWASKGWGGMVIPRIGMEVIVEHLRGDPDKPIVTGCVYNGANRPPYELPAHKTRSTFKTDTHQGTGFNEVRFEDEKNREEIFTHAQKDKHVGVRNNSNTHIGGYRHTQVSKNKTRLVFGTDISHSNLSKTMASSKDVLISAGQDARVPGTRSMQFDDPKRFYVNYSRMSSFNDTIVDGREGALYLDSKAETSIDAGGDVDVRAEGSASIRSKEGVSLSTLRDIKVDTPQSIIQSAGQKFIATSDDVMVFKCGNAHLLLKANGDIEMIGRDIKLNGRKIWLN